MEELLQLGAKKELKVTVLSLWTALLRNKQIAFFDKIQPDLPKLGLRFCTKDAEVIYNHKFENSCMKQERNRILEEKANKKNVS